MVPILSTNPSVDWARTPGAARKQTSVLRMGTQRWSREEAWCFIGDEKMEGLERYSLAYTRCIDREGERAKGGGGVSNSE